MIISEKCNCCIHEQICAFKSEYLAACKAIRDCGYNHEHINGVIKYVKDSNIDVSIRCPHMMAQSAVRKSTD